MTQSADKLMIDSLTKERDEYAKASDTMAMVHKVARDTLNARMDVLEAAAKLALDALETAQITLGSSHAEFGSYEAAWDKYADAIAALKKAGVQ